MATEQTARRVFTGLIILSIILLALVVRPFAKAFFLAAVLAGTFYGLYSRLSRKLRGHNNLAAGVIVSGVILALLLPLGGLTAFIVTEVSDGVKFVSDTVQREGVEGLIGKIPSPVRGPVERLLERIPWSRPSSTRRSSSR